MTKHNILQAIKYLGTSGDSFLDIENYQKYRFATEQIHCHHRREISEGKTTQQLIAEGKYYDVPASDLIFLTASEHGSLHKMGKMSGANNPHFGKRHSSESRQRMSESHKGKPLSEEHKQKLSVLKRGLHRYTNGTKNVWAKECPEGFRPGLLRRKETPL